MQNYWNVFWGLNSGNDCFSVDSKSQCTDFFSRYWRDVFDCQVGGISAIDLACGSGFVGKALVDRVPDSVCYGFEKANISGEKIYKSSKTRSEFRLYDNVSLESMYLLPASINLAVSQFGVEYSNVALVLNKLLEAFKPQGDIHFCIHATDSVLTKTSDLEHRLISFIYIEQDIIAVVREILIEFLENKSLKMNDVFPQLSELDTILKETYRIAEGNIDLVNSLFIDVYYILEKYSSYKMEFSADRLDAELESMKRNSRCRVSLLSQQMNAAKNDGELIKISEYAFKLGYENILFEKVTLNKQFYAWQFTATSPNVVSS